MPVVAGRLVYYNISKSWHEYPLEVCENSFSEQQEIAT